MKCFHTLYGLFDEATFLGTPGFAVNTLWAPVRPLLNGLDHFHVMPSLPNKHTEHACTEDAGWRLNHRYLNHYWNLNQCLCLQVIPLLHL